MQSIRNLRVESPERLLEKLKIHKIPDMAKLSKKLRIDIKLYDPYSSGREFFEESGNIAAIINIDNKTKERMIIINNKTNRSTYRFYIAYLIALYQLCSDPKKNFTEIIFQETIYNMKAYNYAMGLLIPDKLLSEEDVSAENYEQLAKKYHVSTYLMEKAIKRKNKERNFEVIK